MSIHPQFSVIIGILNATEDDPRFTRRITDFFEKLPSHFLDGSPCDDGLAGNIYFDVLYNPDCQLVAGGREQVVGYVLSQQYDGEILYALYTCISEVFDPDIGFGQREFPKRKIEDYEQAVVLSGKTEAGSSPEDVQFCHQYNLFYAYEDSRTTAKAFRRAKKTLELAGWNLGYDELTKLLVWEWA